jgi:hypothetical protein
MALAMGGLFNMVSVVLAEGTAAGTLINNTATATYEDNDGNPLNATSNTVTIIVAEVAGLTAVPTGIVDVDGGAVEAGDALEYYFDVTNVGNDPTDVFIPGANNVGENQFDATQVQVLNTATSSWVNVPADGSTLSSLGLPPLAADATIQVRVLGTPSATARAGDPIGVTLGNTGPNDNSAATQNQGDAPDGSNLNEVRTVGGAPVNAQREASAEQNVPFAASVRPLALATVLKTAAVAANNPGSPTDDQITYTLGMRVEDTDPSGLFQPASLEGTTMNLNGSNQTRILVSDAIPTGTVLQSVSTSLPPGWQAVYSTSAGNNPLDTATPFAWTTAAPTNLSTVTRVGFVYNGTLAPNYTTTGLSFTVVTSGLNPATGGVVQNIAQVFGETVGDGTNEVVYDESGDQSPNNYTGITPPDATGTNYVPGTDDGIPDRTTDGVDTNNNNTGTGPNGEVNVVSIVPATDDILNGPDGTPGAVGPTDDNDDFTNLSSNVPANQDPTVAYDPNVVTFSNTLSNPASSGFLSNVTLQPLSPSAADAVPGAAVGQYGVDTDIPDGTVVTISYGGNTAEYTYNQGAGIFNLTAGSPINVGDVLPGQQITYTVEVDLPSTLPLDEVSIPIIAFPDDDPVASPGYTGETTNNITINRVYTGFMELVKEVRILDATGAPKAAAGWTTTPTSPNYDAQPGEYIEYRISYRNISTPAAGSGNVTLNADNFTILEDGNANGNSWDAVTTHQQATIPSIGSVNYYQDNPGSVTATSDPASGTDVEAYENVVGTVNSDGDLLPDGTFQFRRLVD